MISSSCNSEESLVRAPHNKLLIGAEKKKKHIAEEQHEFESAVDLLP